MVAFIKFCGLEASEAMKGMKSSVVVAGEQHTLWHGFDKSIAEQTRARRTMLIHKWLEEHFIAKGLGDGAA